MTYLSAIQFQRSLICSPTECFPIFTPFLDLTQEDGPGGSRKIIDRLERSTDGWIFVAVGVNYQRLLSQHCQLSDPGLEYLHLYLVMLGRCSDMLCSKSQPIWASITVSYSTAVWCKGLSELSCAILESFNILYNLWSKIIHLRKSGLLPDIVVESM